MVPVILVHSSVPFDPDRFEDAMALVEDLAEQSRQEPGVVRYRAMVDVADEHTVRFFEQYDDEASWAAHTRTEHYERFVDRLPDLVDGPMETVNFVDVDPPEVHHFTAEDIAGDGS